MPFWGGAMDLLLSADERPVCEIREADGPFVVVCEHASNRLPRALGSLGLGADDLKRHIAWDPGAVEVAAGIADRLGGALVTQRYSRLPPYSKPLHPPPTPCNRPPPRPDATPPRSEDTTTPGNVGRSEAAKARPHRAARGRDCSRW